MKFPVLIGKYVNELRTSMVAYIRFASVYRQFKDDAFMSELETMVKTEHKSND